MKKFLFIATAAVAALSFASCNKDFENEGNPVAPETAEIVFTAGGIHADVETRATAVTSLSSFNVLCVTGTAGSSESEKFNVPFSGTTTYTGGKYWPDVNPSYKFYASNEDITSTAGGPTVVASNETDVVCATCLVPAFKASNALTFEHVFARLGKCTIAAPEDGCSVSDLKVSVTPKTGGTFNLYSGNGKTDGTGWSSTTTGVETTIASALSSSADNDLYLVPGSYTLAVSYTLTKGDFTKSYTKSSTVSLVGGKINNITATLPGASSDLAVITFTVNIKDWEENNITANIG